MLFAVPAEVLQASFLGCLTGCSLLSCPTVHPDDSNQPNNDHPKSLVRVSDAEREQVVVRLNAATSQGRLTLEEFSDRVSSALAARTRGDLDALVADLPIVGWFDYQATPAPRPQIVPLGSLRRSGRWQLDRDSHLGTVVGSVKLDMRHAEFVAPVVDMHVQAVLGSVKIWIPHGVAVEVTGQSVLGSRSVAEDIPTPGAPLLRLRIDTVVGSVKVFRR
jgi:hypothetical protein